MTDESKAMVVAGPTAVATLPLTPPRGLISAPELSMIDQIAAAGVAAPEMMPEHIKTKAQAVAIMVAGHELGFAPFVALRHVIMIKGAVSVSSQGLASLALANVPDSEIVVIERSDEKAVVEGRRPGAEPLRITYTIEDAKRADLTKGVNWSKYPADMLTWRAVSRVCRLYFGDAINAVRPHNVYMPQLDEAEAEALPDGAAEAPAAVPEDLKALPPEHADAGAVDAFNPREAFVEWCRDRNLDTTAKICQVLGISADGDDPIGEHWLTPAREGGLTDDESYAVAQSAMMDVVREAKKAKGKGEANAWGAAISTVQPMGQLQRAIGELKERMDAGRTDPDEVPLNGDPEPVAPEPEATGAEAPLPQH